MAKEDRANEALKQGFKAIVAVAVGVIAMLVMTALITNVIIESETLPDIPTPELSEGMRGQLGIDKNVNETTIDAYLNRSDSVYRDMRLPVDPANYENIGGDKYLSGIVAGFEVVPLPYIIAPEGLPEEVGTSYTGSTLFTRLENGKVVANYDESMQILEDLFPKDKNIFLMCGGGGYAGMTKSLLVELGWDGDKIWNVGGFWYYEGNNKVDIKTEDGKYAFWNLDYHLIDFKTLTAKHYVD
jgi:rhodanese-related sulfurtransferase